MRSAGHKDYHEKNFAICIYLVQEYRIRATQFAPVDCITLGDLLMTVHEDPELKFIIDAFGVKILDGKEYDDLASMLVTLEIV
jgi:hypothetical protein